ncbi:hypothetical protein Pelo_3538 [Pelomyxa schiedti]|nr:hypothetical protein Pelo_3538 [Pelomyxa schiedti]
MADANTGEQVVGGDEVDGASRSTDAVAQPLCAGFTPGSSNTYEGGADYDDSQQPPQQQRAMAMELGGAEGGYDGAAEGAVGEGGEYVEGGQGYAGGEGEGEGAMGMGMGMEMGMETEMVEEKEPPPLPPKKGRGFVWMTFDVALLVLLPAFTLLFSNKAAQWDPQTSLIRGAVLFMQGCTIVILVSIVVQWMVRRKLEVSLRDLRAELSARMLRNVEDNKKTVRAAFREFSQHHGTSQEEKAHKRQELINLLQHSISTAISQDVKAMCQQITETLQLYQHQQATEIVNKIGDLENKVDTQSQQMKQDFQTTAKQEGADQKLTVVVQSIEASLGRINQLVKQVDDNNSQVKLSFEEQANTRLAVASGITDTTTSLVKTSEKLKQTMEQLVTMQSRFDVLSTELEQSTKQITTALTKHTATLQDFVGGQLPGTVSKLAEATPKVDFNEAIARSAQETRTAIKNSIDQLQQQFNSVMVSTSTDATTKAEARKEQIVGRITEETKATLLILHKDLETLGNYFNQLNLQGFKYFNETYPLIQNLSQTAPKSLEKLLVDTASISATNEQVSKQVAELNGSLAGEIAEKQTDTLAHLDTLIKHLQLTNTAPSRLPPPPIAPLARSGILAAPHSLDDTAVFHGDEEEFPGGDSDDAGQSFSTAADELGTGTQTGTPASSGM